MSDFKNSIEKIQESQAELLSLYHELDKKQDIMAARVADHLDSDKKNLELLGESLQSVNDRLAEYNQGLEVHIQGVKEAHEHNRLLREQIELYKSEIETRLTIVETPLQWFKTTKRAAGWLATVLGAVAVLGAAIKWLITVL